jgi:hypothetical protein
MPEKNRYGRPDLNDHSGRPSIEECRVLVANMKDPAALQQLAKDILLGKIQDNDKGSLTNELVGREDLPFVMAEKLARFHVEKTHRALPKHSGKNPQPLRIAYQLCIRRDATSRALANWSTCWERNDLEVLIGHPNMTYRVLLKVVQRCGSRPVVRAIWNGHVSPRKISRFALSNNFYLKWAAALTTKKTEDLRKLAKDKNAQIRRAAVLNPAANLSLIEKVALHDGDLDVLTAAIKKISRRAVLKKVCHRLFQRGLVTMSLLESIRNNDNTPVGFRAWAALCAQPPLPRRHPR